MNIFEVKQLPLFSLIPILQKVKVLSQFYSMLPKFKLLFISNYYGKATRLFLAFDKKKQSIGNVPFHANC